MAPSAESTSADTCRRRRGCRAVRERRAAALRSWHRHARLGSAGHDGRAFGHEAMARETVPNHGILPHPFPPSSP